MAFPAVTYTDNEAAGAALTNNALAAGLSVTGLQPIAQVQSVLANLLVDDPATLTFEAGDIASGTFGSTITPADTGTYTFPSALVITGALSGVTTLAASSTITVTSASATALAVGLAGATNPAFVVDSATGSQAAGLKVTGATAAGNVAAAVISSGSNANLTIDAKGSGSVTVNGTATGDINLNRNTVVTGTFNTTSHIVAAAAVSIGFNGRSTVQSASDGVLLVSNNAATDFGRLQLGGTTSSFPALKRSTTLVAVRLADDSADAGLTASTLAASTSVTVTSASATALAVGLAGATDPAFRVDSSTGTQAAGLNVIGATAAGTVAVAVISSGADASLTVNAKGTGTIGIGSVSTGAVTITPATTHTGAVTFSSSAKSTSATAGIGYATGAGGAATQQTNKATAVAINALSGAITMNAAQLDAGVEVSFSVTNTSVLTGDVILVNHASAGTAGAYMVQANSIVNATSFAITVTNLTAGNLSEAIVLNFAIFRGVSA